MTETSLPTGFAPRTSRSDVERGTRLAPKFGPDGLLPAIASDAETGEVLMLAYMNAEALARTIETGEAHYYSRSRQRLWRKGESSGQRQRVREIRIDCDQDAVWLRVEQLGGGACHVGYRSCFYRRVGLDNSGTPELATVLDPVEADRGDAD